MIETILAALLALALFALFPELIIGIVKLLFWLAATAVVIGGVAAVLVIWGAL